MGLLFFASYLALTENITTVKPNFILARLKFSPLILKTVGKPGSVRTWLFDLSESWIYTDGNIIQAQERPSFQYYLGWILCNNPLQPYVKEPDIHWSCTCILE